MISYSAADAWLIDMSTASAAVKLKMARIVVSTGIHHRTQHIPTGSKFPRYSKVYHQAWKWWTGPRPEPTPSRSAAAMAALT